MLKKFISKKTLKTEKLRERYDEDDKIFDGISFHPVETIEEVLELVFTN